MKVNHALEMRPHVWRNVLQNVFNDDNAAQIKRRDSFLEGITDHGFSMAVYDKQGSRLRLQDMMRRYLRCVAVKIGTKAFRGSVEKNAPPLEIQVWSSFPPVTETQEVEVSTLSMECRPMRIDHSQELGCIRVCD